MYPKGDEPYVDPSETNGQTRPIYESARSTVEARQNMQQLHNGNWAYQSAFSNKWHVLDQYGQEAIPRQDGKGYNYRQPALDHKIQYAALNEHYHSVVQEERQKGSQGLQRRHSFDLHDAFAKAVADPKNLRLVSHQEHVLLGGSKRMGQFGDSEKREAKALFDKHLNKVNSSFFDRASFDFSRPRSSVPLPQGTSTKMEIETRSMTRKKNGLF